MITKEQVLTQDIRTACLLRAFSDINCDFTDWYHATQLDIEQFAKELL